MLRSREELARHIVRAAVEGRRTFRFDTFGDERFWERTPAASGHCRQQVGGVGAGLSRRRALALGLKVDQDALPGALISELKSETSISMILQSLLPF